MKSILKTSSIVRPSICAVMVAASAFLLQARENEVEHQEIERPINLIRTDAAPSNAVGIATLEVGHHEASLSNRIEIHTSGLAAGVYTVTVFDRAGTNAVVLGTFGATIVGDNSDNDTGHHRGRGGRDDSAEAQRHGTDDGNEGEAQFPTPDSINAADLGRIAITDAGGVEMLVGDFSDIANTVAGNVSEHVIAEHGDGDDDASGIADIKAHMRRGRGNGKFTLNGQNLPPNSDLTLLINGEDKGQVRTNRRGRLHVVRSHRALDVLSISMVSVRDDSGAEVLHAHF